jgi:vibriolysin
MNKKKWSNHPVVFTITMVLVVCCWLSSSLWAATKIDFHTDNAEEYIRLLNENDSREEAAIGPLFGLTPDEKFTLLRQRTDFNEVTHSRYQQLYKGIPVWGIQTVISRDSTNKVVRLHGSMIKESPNDVKDIPFPLDALGALRQMEVTTRWAAIITASITRPFASLKSALPAP